MNALPTLVAKLEERSLNAAEDMIEVKQSLSRIETRFEVLEQSLSEMKGKWTVAILVASIVLGAAVNVAMRYAFN